MLTSRGERLGAALASLWLVAAVVVDLLLAPTSVVSLFGLAPLIACAVLSTRATGVFAALAVATSLAAGWWDGDWQANTTQQVIRLVDVVLVSAAAVTVSVVRVRRERRYRRAVAIAEAAQRAILPTLPAVAGTVAVATRYLSAAEDALVGGDLYDYHAPNKSTRFLIGDVRGKGISAVEQAARVIRAFRQFSASETSLVRVAQRMSRYLVPFLDDEEFVTALIVEVADPLRLTFVNCGHPPPVLVRAGGSVSYLEPAFALPLGLDDTYEAITVPWEPGDRLLMYTDGLSEARDKWGEFLSPLSLENALMADGVDKALDGVLDIVHRHVPDGHLHDDLAVLLLENLAADRMSETVPEQASGVADVVWLPVTRSEQPSSAS